MLVHEVIVVNHFLQRLRQQELQNVSWYERMQLYVRAKTRALWNVRSWWQMQKTRYCGTLGIRGKLVGGSIWWYVQDKDLL